MGSPLTALGRRARAAQDRALADAPAATTAEALLGRLARRRRAVRLGAIAGAIGAVVIALGAGFALRPRPLSFALMEGEGRAGREGEWISAGEARDVALRFSDGSRFALAPASQARVAAIVPEGARLVLERGAVEAAVVHRPRGAWDLDAGPFTVHVTGTRFRVAWVPEVERLDLVLIEGSVRVTGPLLEGGRAVVAGETLEVRVKEHRLEVRRDREQAAQLATPPLASSSPAIAVASAPEVAPSPRASAAPPSLDVAPPRVADIGPTPPAREAAPLAPLLSAAPVPAVSAPPTASAAPSAAPSWREVAASGRYRDALTRAEAEGFEGLCESGSASDLLALGDAARFAGNGARAKYAYLALRRRFPGARDAAVAAFVLGRMAFDRDGAFAQAAKWFGTYLTEAPSGSYARDASGRLVEALQRSGDLRGARVAAQRYLDAYPSGPHAELSRSVAFAGDDGAAGGPKPPPGGAGQ